MGEMIEVTPKICAKCVFGNYVATGQILCNYLLDTGKRRGCPVGKCDKFVEGKRTLKSIKEIRKNNGVM